MSKWFSMLLIVGVWILINLLHGYSQDADEFEILFSKYVDADSLLSEQGITPEIRAKIIEERDSILEEIVSKPEEAGLYFAQQYVSLKNRKSVARQRQMLHFAMQTELAKSEFRGFAREAILETDLSEPRDPLLTTALEYLGEHGEESDLDLMARLDGHINQTYAQIRDRFAARLSERLSKGIAAEPKNSDSLGEQAGSREVNGVETLVESAGKKSSRPPVWGLLIIVVAVVGILVLLIRAFLRRRAS